MADVTVPKPGRHDLTGQVFGRLTVLELARRVNGNDYWRCLCVCGRQTTPRTEHLLQGRSKSCGCLRKEVTGDRQTTHGATRGRRFPREYYSWEHMIKRCRDPKDERFHRYGGRGITVCDRWLNYQAFRDDMGACPKGLTIDRIDNDGHYTPENCRWATIGEQARNRVSNVWLTHGGVTLCRADWAARVGLNSATVKGRLKRGWTTERALTVPVRRHGNTS